MKMNPTLWVYENGAGRWFGHVDYHDGTQQKRHGPFETEAMAHVVLARMNGYEPEPDMLEQRQRELERKV